MAERKAGRVVLSRAALHLIVTLPTGEYTAAEQAAFLRAVRQSMPELLPPPPPPSCTCGWCFKCRSAAAAGRWSAEELTELACEVLALDYQRRALLTELRRKMHRDSWTEKLRGQLQRLPLRCEVSRFGGGRCVRAAGHDGAHAFEWGRGG